MLDSLAFLDTLRQLEVKEKKKNLYRIPYYALKNENKWANDHLREMTKSQKKIWQRICYLEAYGQKGHVDCTNKYLAKTLSVSISTIERAMRFFRERDLIWCNSYAKRKKNKWFGRKRIICTIFNVNNFLDSCMPKIPAKKRKREMNLFLDWMKKNTQKNQNEGCIEDSTKLKIDSNFIYKRTSRDDRALESRKSNWINPEELAQKENWADLGQLIATAHNIAKKQPALYTKREELKKYITWAWQMKKDRNKKFHGGIVRAAIHAALHGYAMEVIEKDRLMQLGEFSERETSSYFDLLPHLRFEYGRFEPQPMANRWAHRAKEFVHRLYNEYYEVFERLQITPQYDAVEIKYTKIRYDSPYIGLAIFDRVNIFAEECEKCREIVHAMRMLLREDYAKARKSEACYAA